MARARALVEELLSVTDYLNARMLLDRVAASMPSETTDEAE